ncbi:MAG: permease [Candidatus Promineifilaceae bacterium]|nr:permease [Candidatus Promineifilaceae bacterium]
MTVATATLVVLAAAMWVYAWQRGDGSHRRGVVQGWRTLRRTAALLVLAFIIVGYVNVLSPQDLVRAWIGPESGLSGLLLAEVIGIILPGGPYVVFPLIAVLYEAGAGIGQAVTMVTSWATLALLTVTFELPFMGWRFAAVRWGLGLMVPLLAGVVTYVLFG